jgi:hypothetical protein
VAVLPTLRIAHQEDTAVNALADVGGVAACSIQTSVALECTAPICFAAKTQTIAF